MIAETAQFADHPAYAYFLGLGADSQPAFLMADALVEHLPNQTARRWVMAPDRLGMAEARDEPAVHDIEDCPLGAGADAPPKQDQELTGGLKTVRPFVRQRSRETALDVECAGACRSALEEES